MDQITPHAARVIVAAALALCATPTLAATGSGQSRTTVLDRITFTNTGALDFGRATAGTTAGRIVINQNSGARTRTGGVTLVGGTPRAATFTVTGTENRIVRLTITTGTITLTNGTGGTMTVNTFRLNGVRDRNLGPSGTINVQVGARLNVNANQAPGNYTGTFALNVDYL